MSEHEKMPDRASGEAVVPGTSGASSASSASGASRADGQPGAPRRRRRGGLFGLMLFAVLVAALALGVAVALGRPIDAPPWLRERIEARIAATLPGLEIDFGRMSVKAERDGLARVILWDVEIRNARGASVAVLSDVEAGFAPLPLLRGKVVVREARLSGAFLTLTRDEQGKLGLALGDAFAAGTRAPDLPQMVAMVDRAFADPRLAGLREVEADALTIRYEDRRARRGWTIDGGRLRLQRSGSGLDLSGDLALLGGGDRAASLAVSASSPIGSRAVEFGLRLIDLPARDIATQSPALAFLKALDAPISGALRGRMDQTGGLGPLSATLQIGAGALRPNAATRPIPFDQARTYFTYDPATGTMRFDEIAVSAPEGAFTATGKTVLDGPAGGWPDALTGQIRLSNIRLADDATALRGIDLSGADMAFRLSLDPFRLSLGRLAVTDPALPLRASGEVVARPDGWEIALDATLASSTPEEVLSFWPETAIPRPRQWVVDNLREGRIEDATFALRNAPGEAPMIYVDFGFAGGRVQINPKLPEISGGAGRITIHEDRFALWLEEGRVEPGQGGAIDLAGSAFVIPDLRARPATAQVTLNAEGSVTAALAYIDNEAWRVLQKAGRDPGLATGRARVTGRIALPIRKGNRFPDVTLALEGTLTGVESATLVPDRVLKAGRLALSVDNRRVAIEGPVTLSGVPAEGRWEQPLQGGGPGRVTADLRLSPQTLAAFGIALPDGMLRGSGTGRLQLDLPAGKPPAFTVESDLAGIGLAIAPLGWTLPERTTGAFRISGTLGKPVAIDGLSLSGAGLEAQGGLTLAPGGGLGTLSLSRLRLGDWLDATGRLTGRGATAMPAVEITGGTLDLRRATLGGGAGSGAAGGAVPLSVALDRLQVTDAIVLQGLRAELTAGAGMQGRFTAALGGTAPIEGRVAPRDGRSALRITGADAGDILRAAGLLRSVQDGNFALELEPVAGRAGTYDGRVRIEGARLQDAPVIASLLDAVSIVGILDQLNGPGIFFSEVEALFRLTPGQVILRQSSAVGPSMGVSMDGYYDLAAGQMDFQGVLSPVYVLNAVGRIIARKGEGLIGFNFNLRGPVASPQVSVNPLSAFTPGIFRDIFRRPPPEVSQ